MNRISDFELSASCLGLVRFEQQPLEDRGSETRKPFFSIPGRRFFLRPVGATSLSVVPFPGGKPPGCYPAPRWGAFENHSDFPI